MVTHHPEDGHPPSPGWSKTSPRMVIHHPQDCHPSPHGCSPTIPRTVTHKPKDGNPPSLIWSPIIPRTINQHPKDGLQPSSTCSSHIPRTVTQHTQNAHAPFPELSPTPSMVINLQKNGCQPGRSTTKGQSPTNPRMISQYHHDGHPPLLGRCQPEVF